LDPQLAAFWQSAWENSGGTPVGTAIEKMAVEARRDLDMVVKILKNSEPDCYHYILDQLGCLTSEFRGSGFKTALVALALAHLYREDDPQLALVAAANELESDTDTIATMAGALLGTVSKHAPDWPIQDRDYIVSEARRLAEISLGHPQGSFTYPDLGHWNPPVKQTDAIGWFDDGLAMVGLGLLTPKSEEYRSGDAIWQWFLLPFGQTVLAKRKSNLKEKVLPSQLPGPYQPARLSNSERSNEVRGDSQSNLPLGDTKLENRERFGRSQPDYPGARGPRNTIDAWTDEVIYSDFDNLTLGRLLNRCIEQSQSVEAAVGFASIIAKAKLARQRRRR
jgi:hypothetical protein